MSSKAPLLVAVVLGVGISLLILGRHGTSRRTSGGERPKDNRPASRTANLSPAAISTDGNARVEERSASGQSDRPVLARPASNTRRPHLPHNLDEVPRSATLEAALASVKNAWDGSPQSVANLNYRLERLSDIADCTAGQISRGGYVDVLVHFSAAHAGAEGVAENIEIKGLRLDPNERDSALLCIRDAIVGSRNIVADAQFADVPRVAPMRIRLPIEDSAIYLFLETGDLKYYGNDYDGRP